MKSYSIQVLSCYDAFHNRVLNRWFTVEYRRVNDRNEGEAIRAAGTVGPNGSIGRVTCLGSVKEKV